MVSRSCVQIVSSSGLNEGVQPPQFTRCGVQCRFDFVETFWICKESGPFGLQVGKGQLARDCRKVAVNGGTLLVEVQAVLVTSPPGDLALLKLVANSLFEHSLGEILLAKYIPRLTLLRRPLEQRQQVVGGSFLGKQSRSKHLAGGGGLGSHLNRVADERLLHLFPECD